MKKHFALGILVFGLVTSMSFSVTAQDKLTVLTGDELTRIVPPGFYFQGLSGPTQMRNSAVARFGTAKHVIAALVDTSGYSADVRSKYDGFLICDTEISIGGQSLPTGAYGIGSSNDSSMTILDVGGNQVLSVKLTRDANLRRPRPLGMLADEAGVRLYRGRDYVVISVK